MYIAFNSGVDSVHTHTHTLKKIEEHQQFVFIVVNYHQVSDFLIQKECKARKNTAITVKRFLLQRAR